MVIGISGSPVIRAGGDGVACGVDVGTGYGRRIDEGNKRWEGVSQSDNHVVDRYDKPWEE